MLRWMRLSAATVGALAVGVGTVIGLGNSRWAGATRQIIHALDAAQDQAEAAVFRAADLDGLPAPVIRFFRATLRDGQPLVRTARFVQTGEFRLGDAASAWRPMEAMQYFSVRPVGLVWDARIQMAPLLGVRVRDTYAAGTGGMQARLLATVPVMDAPRAPELNEGALQRYLAEAAWFPTALLPSQGVVWSPIDDARALATLTDSGLTVALEFQFGESGEIMAVSTPRRGRFVDGRYVPTPWGGRFLRYEAHDGMRIPTGAAVEWRLPSGNLEYARIRLTAARYTF